MTLRTEPPKVAEAQFTKLIRRGSMPSAAKSRQNAPTRATLLLRLEPDLLKQLDAMAKKERLNRHALIVQILERITWKRRR